MKVIAESGCVRGKEQYIKLAIPEAFSNARQLLGPSEAGSPPLLP